MFRREELCVTQQIVDPKMTEKSHAAGVAETFLNGFNKSDWKAVRAVLADDSVYEEHGTQRRIEGADATMGVYQAWKTAMPDVRGVVQNVATAGDTALVELVWEGTHTGPLETPTGTVPASGKSQRTPGVFSIDVKNGVIATSRNYFDMLTFLQQIGAAPA
jgi:steroid delta-isomerase-like uncharacterized protein